MDAKTEKTVKADFELHVALIMKTEGVTKSKANFRAWAEGPAGLARRLGQTEMPLKGGEK